MRAYIGTKTLAAMPMTLGFYNNYRGWTIPENEDPNKEGYMVQYPDNYILWSPKEIFETSYREILSEASLLVDVVFPSTERTITVRMDDEYGGAHYYQIQNSLGFHNGMNQYDPTIQHLQFVQKNADGTMIPGVQNEQLALIMLDRCEKLNAKFPSEQSAMMITGLTMFLDACQARIKDRIQRGVMGDLKK
jgi:hypothetical protein